MKKLNHEKIEKAIEDYGVISKYDDGKRWLLQDEQENKINLNFNYKVAAGIYIGKKNTGKEVVIIDESYKFVTKGANEELKRIQKVSKFKMGR